MVYDSTVYNYENVYYGQYLHLLHYYFLEGVIKAEIPVTIFYSTAECINEINSYCIGLLRVTLAYPYHQFSTVFPSFCQKTITDGQLTCSLADILFWR